MQLYVALLRGINVGGHKRVLMADLKKVFVKIGLKNPITYIQSGNVIFESNHEDYKKIELLISKGILTTFGYNVPVMVRKVSELEDIINKCPFYSKLINTKQLHITFLNEMPSQADVLTIQSAVVGHDKFIVDGQSIYICIEGAYHKTKLSNQFFEKKLKVSTTTRNWKTLNKLVEIAHNV